MRILVCLQYQKLVDPWEVVISMVLLSLVEKFDKQSGIFILRCIRDSSREVLASLLFLDSVCNSPAIVRTLDVKSTLDRSLVVFKDRVSRQTHDNNAETI